MNRLRLLVSFVLLFPFVVRGQEGEPAPPGETGLEIEVAPMTAEEIPEELKPWIPWVKAGHPEDDAPRNYDDAGDRFAVWTSRLQLDAANDGATFTMKVVAFGESWLGLPGSVRIWPQEVSLNGEKVPVVERAGRPSLKLKTGDYTVSGQFLWSVLPQQLRLPPEVGMLSLSVNGEEKRNPSWEEDGTLWLQRQASTEPVDEDFLSTTVHSILEDGIPMWFETRIELIVAGKSREETLGVVLPEGWKLSSLQAPIPVAVDEYGMVKAQLRAGRWSIALRAFQTQSVSSVQFAEGGTAAVEDQAIAFRARPDFRQAEVTGMPQIDVAQTQVPDEWRSLPIYRWDAEESFEIVERVRGPGERAESPLKIQRSLWLDDDGKQLTYQDSVQGSVRTIRRLDAAEGHELGSVSVFGEPQLITHNPEGGAPGIEVRAPELSAIATGRIALGSTLPATGWQSDADDLRAVLQLPPGYRLFALFGADYSRGDWLTSWTLLDLFLLLLFTLAVFRLRGWGASVLAFAAFSLAYHEVGAPRVPWLLLLVPVALVAFMPEGQMRKWVVVAKWGAAGILLLTLLPFLTYQLQGAVFPQLERSAAFSPRGNPVTEPARVLADSVGNMASSSSVYQVQKTDNLNYRKSKLNLKNDPKAIIQTGPGVPSWTWRTVEFGWSGPVSAEQEVRPILIPPVASRILAVVRTLTLAGLLILLLTVRRKNPEKKEDGVEKTGGGGKAVAAGFAIALFATPSLQAQDSFPSPDLLEELKNRVTSVSDAFPGAASISAIDLNLVNSQLRFQVEYHAADRCAAPVPVPLNSVIPVGATWDTGSNATFLRNHQQLWVLLPSEGIHLLEFEGRLKSLTDWEWGFSLKPRSFSVEAEGWNVSGIRADGSAEDQILFSRVSEEDGSGSTANYDRPDTDHALLVERQIELGLVWRVTTTVSRLSPTGRAVVLDVPVLPGEKVVSADSRVKGGVIEVRLAPNAERISWEGELSIVEELSLETRIEDAWTEQWKLVASPVWNVGFAGLSPTFSVSDEQLVPMWQPWPGESAQVSISRPEAVKGAVVTIDSAEHTLNPGRRQRSSSLKLSVRTSLGEDFPIVLPTEAEVVSLKHFGQAIPIRKEGDAVVVPLRPGPQEIELTWRRAGTVKGWTRVDAVNLPVESANVTTVIRPASHRWIVLLDGPLRGPAIRFWGVLLLSILSALVLSRVPQSPLKWYQWLLLVLGLTQVFVGFSLIVVAWLFFIQWRGQKSFRNLAPFAFNTAQATLIVTTLIAVCVFIGVASAGLLGDPKMYIAGGGSTDSYLKWFSAKSSEALPQPGYGSVSIWWFRLVMLLWALWLAASLVGWLRTAWRNSAEGGHFMRPDKLVPPELPEKSKDTEQTKS